MIFPSFKFQPGQKVVEKKEGGADLGKIWTIKGMGFEFGIVMYVLSARDGDYKLAVEDSLMDAEEAKLERINARTDTKEMDIAKYMGDLERKSKIDYLLDEYNTAKEAGDTQKIEKVMRSLKSISRSL